MFHRSLLARQLDMLSPMLPSSRAIGRFAGKFRDQRWRMARWRIRTERPFLARAGKSRPRMEGRVLSYHSTGTPEWGVNDVTPERFFEQLESANRLGYRFVPADSVVAGRSGPLDLAITFDDGLRSILAVAPYLESRRIPFTVFPVAAWASEPSDRFLSWSELADLGRAGATFGSHSMTHANFRDLSASGRRAELEESRAALTHHLGIIPTLFAIPFGRSRDWDSECTTLAREAGYTGVFAQSEGRRPEGTVGRSFISKYDGRREFRALLEGRFDRWEEWY